MPHSALLKKKNKLYKHSAEQLPEPVSVSRGLEYYGRERGNFGGRAMMSSTMAIEGTPVLSAAATKEQKTACCLVKLRSVEL